MKEILQLIKTGTAFNPVSSIIICRELNISDVMVRKAVNKYRSQRIPILANRFGYWIAESPEEVSAWLKSDSHRINKQLRAHNQVAKYITGEFYRGQEELGVR